LKHLFSLATLAATATLALALTASAKADLVSFTTAAPNPSGYATCTGTNPDGSTATWTVGGNIVFTSDYSNPPAHLFVNGQYAGYHHTHPGTSGYPYSGSTCNYTAVTSSNVKAGCVIAFLLKITYTPYGGQATKQILGGQSFHTGQDGSHTYNPVFPITFADVLDSLNVQYKVCSDQLGDGGIVDRPSYLGVAATPYL
jgi:hypothetical protein